MITAIVVCIITVISNFMVAPPDSNQRLDSKEPMSCQSWTHKKLISIKRSSPSIRFADQILCLAAADRQMISWLSSIAVALQKRQSIRLSLSTNNFKESVFRFNSDESRKGWKSTRWSRGAVCGNASPGGTIPNQPVQVWALSASLSAPASQTFSGLLRAFVTRLLPPLNFISSPSCPSDPRERSVKAVDLSGGPVPQAQTSHLSLHNLPSQLHRQFLLQGQHY